MVKIIQFTSSQVFGINESHNHLQIKHSEKSKASLLIAVTNEQQEQLRSYAIKGSFPIAELNCLPTI